MPKEESLLFFDETTYKTDFRKYSPRPPVKTVYQGKPPAVRPIAPPTKNIHTLRVLRDEIPFYIFHGRKAILHTNPYIVQKKYEKQPDLEREDAQKTRPRLVMTPAVSMDDIDDPKARITLVKDMYTTDTLKAQRDALKPYKNVEAPFPGLPAKAYPITLAKLEPPYVSPEWRMETTAWDGQQLRAYCDSTKSFWLSRDIINPCRACNESATIAKRRKMLREMKYGRH